MNEVAYETPHTTYAEFTATISYSLFRFPKPLFLPFPVQFVPDDDRHKKHPFQF